MIFRSLISGSLFPASVLADDVPSRLELKSLGGLSIGLPLSDARRLECPDKSPVTLTLGVNETDHH